MVPGVCLKVRVELEGLASAHVIVLIPSVGSGQAAASGLALGEKDGGRVSWLPDPPRTLALFQEIERDEILLDNSSELFCQLHERQGISSGCF